MFKLSILSEYLDRISLQSSGTVTVWHKSKGAMKNKYKRNWSLMKKKKVPNNIQTEKPKPVPRRKQKKVLFYGSTCASVVGCVDESAYNNLTSSSTKLE